ncbi:hypothetical protein NW762_003804 [Fusarium torreyae]|uniref:Uncharacterized protein n=1 Tax=Fusarium torreyae TaxID=1237075 RepID=A0A9W8SBG2_9HYPO|nr:hypothetical protein NW762_003804 [Fusarium torreyae]
MTTPSPNPGSGDRAAFLSVRTDADDAPPPPYSETDIYSTSSQPPRSPHSASVAGSAPGPAASGDDAASRMSSTSTTEPVIFTPPLTPRTESNVGVSTPTNQQQHFHVPPSPSAALYFESRPVQTSTSQWEPQIHDIAVKQGYFPNDIPYPETWATSYDITPQDWATFVNFLLPDHDSAKNEAILGEKAKSEDGPDAKSASGDGSVKSELPIDPNESRRRRAEVEAIVQQWNADFFAPRNVKVRLQPEEQSHMPGGWETTFDEPPVPAQAGPSSQRDAAPQRRSSWMGGWGGLQMDDDGIRWGDRFVADSNGLRIGNLVMDSRGIRMNGQGAGAPFGPGPGHPLPPPAHVRDMPPFGNPHWHPNHPEVGPNPVRGRGTHSGNHGPRSRSSSTSSSSSSSSSASSDSIGSLPDYDDLKDQQIPLYIARLEQWTNNPHEMRSKGDVKQLKAELKAKGSKTNVVDPSVDRKALKAQIKGLSQQWRSLKRQQKKERREHRRELKKRRRAERKERRRQKKEMKSALKDQRREQRGRGGHADQPPVPAAPLVPPFQIPPVNVNVPPVNVPPVHVPPPFSGGWGGPGRGAHGNRGCGGRGWGRGWGRGGQGPWGRARGQPQGGWQNPCSFGSPGRGGFCGGSEPQSARSRGDPSGPCPGSWPEDRNQDADIPPPGAASAAKYDTVSGLETEIAAKQKDLEVKDVTIEERQALGKEIEALTETLERTRLEADETYARELANQLDGQ